MTAGIPPSTGAARALALITAVLMPTAALASSIPGTVTEEITVLADGSPPPKPGLKLDIPPFDIETQMMTFPTGLRVMFQHDDSMPVVAVTSVTDHGASSDPEGKEGIAHLVEHLWFRSEHGNLPKTWDLLESEMGCNLNAFTQYDITAYMTVCPSNQLRPMLQLESLRITDPIANVKEEMVTTEIEVVRNEIRMRTENFNIPFFTIFENVNKHMFPKGHPYKRAMAGDHESIRNIVLADVQAFTDAYYRPDTTTVMVVGDIGDTDIKSLLDLVVRTFDPKLLHPKMGDAHIGLVAKEGIGKPDKNNPDHWVMLPLNPDDPKQIIPYLTEITPRAAAFANTTIPEPATAEIGTYIAPVEHPTVAVAWTLPPAYQGNDGLFNIVTFMMNSAMDQGLNSGGITGLKEFTGCGPMAGKHVTTMICAATTKSDNVNANYIADRMLDQISSAFSMSMIAENRAYASFFENQFVEARMAQLAQSFRSMDLFAAVGAGRATEIAQFAHFSGTPTYFDTSMREVMELDWRPAVELIESKITRDRAARVFIKPIPRDELAEKSGDTPGAGGHTRGGGDDGAILNPSIPIATITPPFVRSQFHAPDVNKITEFKLSNGLRVVTMPHGESPLIEARLIVRGGSATDFDGLDLLASRFGKTKNNSEQAKRLAAEAFSGGNDISSFLGIEGVAGNLDDLLYLLRERIDGLEIDLGPRRTWIQNSRKGLVKSWGRVGTHSSAMRREHLNPDHPTMRSPKWEDYDAFAAATWDDVSQYAHSKWQPSNATLLIVGRVTPDEAKEYAATYFGSWKPAAGVSSFARAEVPPPNASSNQKIYVFDDEGKTQTDVTLACPLKQAKDTSPTHQVLGDIARTSLFATLREDGGVVYSPQAAVVQRATGGAAMFMSASIQNDSAVFGLQTYLDFLNKAAAGGLDQGDIAIKKLSRARRYVTQQQSMEQMADRLADMIASDRPWSWFDTYAQELADVSPASLAEITKGCAEHAYVSLTGPKDGIVAQLDEAGFTYEVVDWKQRGYDLHAAADPKGYAKAEKARLKAEAKKAKSEDEDGSDASADNP